MRLRVAIAADHAGFALKQELIRRLSQSLEITDKGADEYDATDDYPDFVEAVGRAVASGEADRGIIICGSGVGACVAANKMRHIRACVCHDTYSAHQGVEHDDMNVLCLGARIIGVELATELTVAFLMARFSNEERHVRRLERVTALEQARLFQLQHATSDPSDNAATNVPNGLPAALNAELEDLKAGLSADEEDEEGEIEENDDSIQRN